jgi:peptidoglycan-associated lipoprotein
VRAEAPPPRPLTEEEIFARKSLDDLNNEHPLDDAYFDYDKSTVRADAQSVMQKNADWLKRWSSTQISIEGHCDERGSAAYNLGLGSRRATAVKDYLVNLGVPASRITIVSKGKEQPFCAQADESCWQQNRRGHFMITGK